MNHNLKQTEPEEEIKPPKICPFNSANVCENCILLVNGRNGVQCAFLYMIFHLSGLDYFRGPK